MRVIATLPPLVSHRAMIINHPLVHELRFNTVNIVGADNYQTRYDTLKRLNEECGAKPLWIDLKTRQLRITEFAYLPYAFVRLSHKISVDLPADIYFKDCVSTIVQIVDGDKLILDGRPERVVGKGEAVNILHPSLVIEGLLTKGDLQYIRAAKKLGLHRYMLSFAECVEDLQALFDEDSNAEIIAKIESLRGLHGMDDMIAFCDNVRLMAARDDLFIQFRGQEGKAIHALESIVAVDENAVVASRILTSLEDKETVDLGDISDLELMRRMGFKTLMFSDGLCFRKDAFLRAMKVLEQYLAVTVGVQ